MRELTRKNYLVFLPDGYDTGAIDWPVLLFLHGSGERGDDLALVKRHGPPMLAEHGREFPFILVAPQCPADQQWDSASLISLLRHIKDEFGPDPERIYLTGLSLGGRGAWQLGMAYPREFAAIVPICGWADPDGAKSLASVPIWAFHGASDEVVSINGSVAMVAALRQHGGCVRLTIYPNTDHVETWQRAYQEQRLYDWLLQQRRQVEPGPGSVLPAEPANPVLDCFCP